MDIELSERETGELSYPRDLLRRFTGGRRVEKPRLEIDEASPPELSLGLSLGGCFSVEPTETRLPRSSSIAAFSVFQNERKLAAAASAPLVRTCSLPADAEVEHRKRKEMQGLKRLEAKRKRLEKIKNGSEIPGLGDTAKFPSMADTGNKTGAAAQLPPRLRSLKSLQEDDEVLKRLTGGLNGSKDVGRDMMTEMPCVSTKGDGPNGRRIEGFLYQYKKGEEVRIVCVCHGSFLTPAEFVKHAGGAEVVHPLRHIVVTPSPAVYY